MCRINIAAEIEDLLEAGLLLAELLEEKIDRRDPVEREAIDDYHAAAARVLNPPAS